MPSSTALSPKQSSAASPQTSPTLLTLTWYVACASPCTGSSRHPGLVQSVCYLFDHLGFIEAKSDTSLFIFRCSSDTVYLLLYVDDIILTASNTELLRRTISALQRKFAMKDLGSLHHFLGIPVERRLDGLFLHQRTYTLDILKRVIMADCKSCTTPVDLEVKLARDSGPPVADASQFWSIA
jgi:hypothetical protein